MKDLEAKLKELPLRAPSDRLDERVMAQRSNRLSRQAPARLRIPVWATAAAAMAMALMGFATGAAWRGEPPVIVEQSPSPPVTVQVIYHAPSSGDPFDFTYASDMFPAGELETTIRTEKGTGT